MILYYLKYSTSLNFQIEMEVEVNNKKYNIVIGIDIGFSGAIAILPRNDAIYAYDMPLIKTGKKSELNVKAIKDIFCAYNKDSIEVYIERAQAMPQQGCVSMFRYGKCAGIIEGILIGLGIPYTLVTPQAWKKAMMPGMDKEKGSSILRVNQLFPYSEIGGRKKDHGKADAVLIAAFGRI